MSILDAVRRFLRGLDAYQERQQHGQAQDDDAFLADLFARFPFTVQAQDWLRQHIRIQIDDLGSTAGGGGWYPEQWLVRLYTAQYEAAIHELTHARWDEHRRNRQVRDAFVAAVHQLAADRDPRWARVHTLAGHYVHGIPTQPGFEHGMLLPGSEWGTGGGPQGEWNDWEMYAGLASGCMADIRLLPPYVRRFYTDLFNELPPGVPSPETIAPHK